jgi:hypothetical protein
MATAGKMWLKEIVNIVLNMAGKKQWRKKMPAFKKLAIK